MGQPSRKVDEVVQRASELLHDFQDVQTPIRRAVGRSEDLRWKPPDFGFYKINFDGAVFGDQVSAGIGVVIRDWEGQIIAALSQKVRFPGFVDLVEALAACRAISFAKELSIHQLVIEGDSLRVIQAINGIRPVRTMYGHVIDDIRFLSSSISCSFLHVKRKGNRLAHALARRAVSTADTDVWLEDLPQDLDDVF